MSSRIDIISLEQITAPHLSPASGDPPERNGTRTASIEGFWNLFKGAYRGTYVHVSPMYQICSLVSLSIAGTLGSHLS